MDRERFEKILSNLGFLDEDEFFRLKERARKALVGRRSVFEGWLENDGTKVGLEAILGRPVLKLRRRT